MSKKLNVALFSGGRGTASIADALLNHSEISLMVITNAYDDGLSTGELRRFIPGMLGPSDIRKNLLRLIDAKDVNGQALRKIFEYRFPKDISKKQGLKFLSCLKESYSTNKLIDLDNEYAKLSVSQVKNFSEYLNSFLDYFKKQESQGKQCISFSDCSLTNVLFAGCYLNCGKDFNKAIENLSAGLPLRGRILNVTQGENLVLMGVKQDKTLLLDEAQIVSKQNASNVADIFLLKSYLTEDEISGLKEKSLDQMMEDLERRAVYPKANLEVVEILSGADIIIYGPGTQHSSLFPSYCTQAIAEAIANNKEAEKVFISNILKDNEIQSETASTLTNKVIYYLNLKKEKRISWNRFFTTFFFQFEEGVESADYVRFDSKGFPFPRERVVLGNWEVKDGLHSGGRVLDELISLVNSHLEKKIANYHYQVSIIVPALDEE